MVGTLTGPAPAAPPARRRRGAHHRRESRHGWLFIAPWAIGFVVFIAGPMVASLVLSFTDYDAINAPQSVGFDNYEQLLSDPKVRLSLQNTMVYTLLHVPATLVVALALAVLLHRVGRASGFFRTVFYLPVMTPPVAAGALFLILLNGQSGLINEVLGWFGFDGPNWTSDPSWIKPGIVLMGLWTVGSTVIILLAALQNVPTELYEAAALDGAGRWAQFRNVTLPLISPTVYFLVLVNTISSLQTFAEVYTMYFGNANNVSSASSSALFYVIYLFQQAFQFLNMGYASAMAWLLFLVIMLITLVQVRASRRLVHYQGDR